jgi:hypothetical protein
MTPGKLSTYLKNGAIWGFIVLELIFFTVAGQFLSLSENAFMDVDNMLLLFKQSAPIGIIAMGMTIVMVNGNIDLSVGATYALSAVVMLDAMTWPVFGGLGDWVIPVACLLALLTGTVLGAINGLIVWKTGVDAGGFRRGAGSGVAHRDMGPADRHGGDLVPDEQDRAWPQRLCHRRQPRGGGQCRHPGGAAHADQFHDHRRSRRALGGGVLF